MAKTASAKKPTKAELEAEVAVEVLVLVPEDLEKNALAKYTPFDQQLQALIAEVESMPPITDKASLAHAEGLSKKLRKYEIAVDKTRIESTKPVRTMLENLKAHCDKMIKTAEGKREYVDGKINAEQIRLQKEAEAEQQRRIDLLTSNGWTMNGQFYTCGINRVLFDQIDTASEEQLNSWVAIGQAEIARVAQEKAEREAKERELAEREAALKAQEAEMQEFLAWKAAKAAAVPAPAPIEQTPPQPIPMVFPSEQPQPSPHAPLPQQNAPWLTPQTAPANPVVTTPAPQFNPVQAPIEVPENIPAAQFDNGGQIPAFGNEAGNSALMELAKLRNSSVSHILSQPEAKVHWNMAIDHIHRIFTTSTEQLTKDQWAQVFLNHKR